MDDRLDLVIQALNLMTLSVAVAVEPATSAAGEAAGETMGAQAPVQDSAATNQDGTVADELKDKPHGDDVQAVEEEKRVDPDSVQVVVPAAAAAASSAEESKVADDASA
jgi:hypothetical protein